MRVYILRRVLQAIPVILALSVLIFLIINLAPGDPLAGMNNPKITAQDLAAKRETLGLNRPLHERYWDWISHAVKGDFGRSLKTGRRPVTEMIAEKLPATILLAVTSSLISWILAIPIGVYSAIKQYSLADYSITVIIFIGLSLPSFFLGLTLIYLFSLKIPIFPTGGMTTPGQAAGFGDVLWHMVLPAFSLGFMGIAGLTRFMRSSMLEVIKQDYIRTARSKGLAEKVVIYKHALRNALIPIVTLFGMEIPYYISGSLITEQIFAWPGMGRLSVSAVFSRDYPVIMAVNMLYAVMVYLGNLVADVSYAIVDPRIRFD